MVQWVISGSFLIRTHFICLAEEYWTGSESRGSSGNTSAHVGWTWNRNTSMLSRFWSFRIRAPIAASPSRHPPRSSMDQAEGLIPMQNYKSWGLLAWITWIEIGRFTNKARGTPQKKTNNAPGQAISQVVLICRKYSRQNMVNEVFCIKSPPNNTQ